MIKISVKGDFKNTRKFLSNYSTSLITKILKKYGQEGVDALSAATPVDTGLTASSWSYSITVSKDFCSITWNNSNVVDHVPIALVLQYGHATRNGGYVEGIDYINPALKPVFDKILNETWKEVKSL